MITTIFEPVHDKLLQQLLAEKLHALIS